MDEVKQKMVRMFPRAIEDGVDQALVSGLYLSTVGVPERGYELAGWVDTSVVNTAARKTRIFDTPSSVSGTTCGNCAGCPGKSRGATN